MAEKLICPNCGKKYVLENNCRCSPYYIPPRKKTFPRDINLVKYRKKKSTDVFINTQGPVARQGDLLYINMGWNKGIITRCDSMTSDGTPHYAKVKPRWRNTVATLDYDTMTLYWFYEGRYKNPSPFAYQTPEQ